MKILGIHTIDWGMPDRESGVDIWRIWRPLEELKKHTDWQIDYQPTFIKEIAKYRDAKEFTEEELEAAADYLGSYDIVFSSYHPDPTAFALMKAVEDRTGTQFVLDVDDNMFAVNEDNPFWDKVDDWGVFMMQRMIRSNRWITTTTVDLQQAFKSRSEVPDGEVFLLPNYIADSYKHDPVDNGDKVVIGYFGGASHFADLHETGILPALQRVMHENKNVYFKSVGIPIDHYLPTKRVEELNGVRGTAWITDLFPTLNFDISIAPLKENVFNHGKSDIKWQESTRMGAAFVASDVGPYKRLQDGKTAILATTEAEWYAALTKLIQDAEYRRSLVAASRAVLQDYCRLEDNWQKYVSMFEKVNGYQYRKELLS